MRTKYDRTQALAMCQDYAEGMSVPSIAIKHGVSAPFAYGALRRAGLIRNRDDCRGPGDLIKVHAPFAEANKARSATAAAARVKAAESTDLSQLTEFERRIIALRIEHPLKSLAELGALMEPPMTKFAYAARLRRALARATK